MNQINSLTSTKLVPAPMSWVENLFARMEGMYGTKFLDMWRDTDFSMVKTLWAEEMGKLTGEELRKGVAALATQDWPPSLPQFVKFCKPEIDPMVAYYKAVEGSQARAKGELGDWPHPAIYWASRPLSFDLMTLSYTQVRSRWEMALEKEMKKGEWDEIPMPMKQLEAPGKTDMSKEKAAVLLKEFNAEHVVKKTTDELVGIRDGLRWAHKIMKRFEDKDPTLPSISLRNAREVLGLIKK